MRICLISREYPPDTGWGGVGTYTYYIANALARRGHDVHVLSLSAKQNGASDSEVAPGLTVHRVAWNGILDELNLFLVAAPTTHFVTATGLALWRRFLELHESKAFDVVEAPEHLATGFFQAMTKVAPVVLKLHTPHSKFVVDSLHGVSASFDHRMVCMFENAAITAADIVCSPSEDMARFVMSQSGVREMLIARNPIDAQRFSPTGNRYKDFGGPTVLTVGRLERRKGQDRLVSAIPEILARIPNAKFVFVGADTDTAPGGGSMREYLQKASPSVEFIDKVDINDMPAIYRSADVVCVPSLYDNAPYSCIEALACGVPVVASDAGGTKEYIAEGEWGYVVNCTSNSDKLADRLVKLLGDSARRKAFGKAARAYVERELVSDVIAIQMEGLYEQAIAASEKRLALYGKRPADALNEAVEMACAFDASMFEAMSRTSVEFRIRHAMRYAASRPKMALANVAAFAFRFLGMKNQAASLERRLVEKTAQRYAATRANFALNTDKGKDPVFCTEPSLAETK